MKLNVTLPLLPLFFFLTSTFGQGGIVGGKVVEESTRLPLEFVNVSLMHSNDTNMVDGAVTDETGAFKMEGVGAGNYQLTISFIGFETLTTTPFLVSANGADAGILSLQPSELLLKEAEVTAEKSTYVSTIDRKIYFTEKDIQAQAGSASELLQNIPSVSVDLDGVVSLRGSSNVTFLLNGRPSALMNKSSASYLQQLPGNTIGRIEVITNPSAKYKPDGTAGIINIVLKKNASLGFNGTVSANAGTNNRYNGSLSLNYNPGKLNLSGSYGFRRNYFPREASDFRTSTDTLTGEQTTFDQHSTASGKPISHTASLGLDFEWNEKNKLGVSGSFFTFSQNRTQTVSTLLRNAAGTISDYTTDRNDHEEEYELEVTASWEHQFEKEDHILQLEASFGKYDELEESSFNDNFKVPDIPDIIGRNTIKKGGPSYTAVAEYVNPIGEDMELEAGYEGEFFNDDLDYASENFDPALGWLPDAGKTNRFLFRQDVHAVYGTLSKEIEDFGILAGLRAEQTFITSNLVGLDSMIPNDYFKLFPTIHLSWQLSDDQQLGLSYSRRVNRPDSDELNPFPEYKDIRDIEAGNPDLKPEQIHSVELGYQLKKGSVSFVPNLYYRYKYDAFTETTSYLNDTTLLTTFENLATDQSAGLEFVLAWNPKNGANLNFSSNLFYNTIDASNLGYSKSRSAVSWDAKLAAAFRLISSTKFQVNANYRSSFISAEGKSLAVYFLNAGLRQDVFKKKASIVLTVSDVFNTMRWAYEIDTPELQQKVTRKRKSQIVYLGFAWRFGGSGKKTEDELLFEDKM